MTKMQELYEKVSRNAMLQEKFTTIVNDADNAGKEAMKEKLVAFAKDEGYDITLQEMQAFFENIKKNDTGELSDIELDMVAGGKTDPAAVAQQAVLTIFTLSGNIASEILEHAFQVKSINS